MTRTRRVALVTVGLVVAGAAAGATAAYLGLAAVILTSAAPARGLRLLAYPPVVALLLGRGALIGAVAGPAVAWGLLRHVSLGRAVAGLCAGALVGSLAVDKLVGELMRRFWAGPIPGTHAWLWGMALGMLAAGALLRRGARPRVLRGAGRPGGGDLAAPAPNVSLQATRTRGQGSAPARSIVHDLRLAPTTRA